LFQISNNSIDIVIQAAAPDDLDVNWLAVRAAGVVA
jgi:hypothetical protein